MLPMGKESPSKPVLASDITMSKRHKAHRREINATPDMETKLKKSIVYNRQHAAEHHKALVKSEHALRKLNKKRV